jgi:hypothetical protein
VHPYEVGGQLEGANGHALSLARITRAGRERKRVEDVESCTRTCRSIGEPRLVVSRTPQCHPSGPHRVGTTRYVLAMGRRPARSARGASLRSAAASVTRPAKGEILVQIEVPSIRPTGSHAWETSDDQRCEVALVAVLTRWLSVTSALSTAGPTPFRATVTVRKRTQYRRADAFVTFAPFQLFATSWRRCGARSCGREPGYQTPELAGRMSPFGCMGLPQLRGDTIAASRTTSTTEKLRG